MSTATTTIRRLATAVQAARDVSKYRVLVLGGGSGGMAVASQLLTHHATQLGRGTSPADATTPQLAIVDPASEHFYQPLWTLVGGGLKQISESRRPMQAVVGDVPGAHWLGAGVAVTSIDPAHNAVKLSDGRSVGYDYLVVAAGMKTLWSAIPGLSEALADPDLMVTSNYHVDYAPMTAKFIREFKGGNAIFTQPPTPIKCAGAPQKIAYLAEETWRQRGIREKCRVQFVTGMGKIFAVEKYAKTLTEICRQRQIDVRLSTELIEVRPRTKEAVFKTLGTGTDAGKVSTEKFDFLHATPPMGPPDFIKASGALANAGGWLNVNVRTLQNESFRNVFALGDCAALPISKTAAAAAAQSKIVTENLLRQIKADADGNTEKMAEYDGYTSCPLVTGANKLVMAEFDGFTLTPRETFAFDQAQERPSMAAINAKVLPHVYWKLMLKGGWTGPSKLRQLFNPLNRN